MSAAALGERDTTHQAHRGRTTSGNARWRRPSSNRSLPTCPGQTALCRCGWRRARWAWNGGPHARGRARRCTDLREAHIAPGAAGGPAGDEIVWLRPLFPVELSTSSSARAVSRLSKGGLRPLTPSLLSTMRRVLRRPFRSCWVSSSWPAPGPVRYVTLTHKHTPLHFKST